MMTRRSTGDSTTSAITADDPVTGHWPSRPAAAVHRTNRADGALARTQRIGTSLRVAARAHAASVVAIIRARRVAGRVWI